jgi:hypothetical protein
MLSVLPVTFVSRAIAVAATADVFVNKALKTRYTRYIADGQRLNPLQMPLQGRHGPATFSKAVDNQEFRKVQHLKDVGLGRHFGQEHKRVSSKANVCSASAGWAANIWSNSFDKLFLTARRWGDHAFGSNRRMSLNLSKSRSNEAICRSSCAARAASQASGKST